jgi:hypothetical protein
MLVEHEGRAPHVDPEAWVAPTAVLCGDVRVAARARVLWNAGLADDGGPVDVREQSVVMEQALLRGRADHPVILPPERHDDIWAVQRALDFPGTVVGIERGGPADVATARYAELFGRHRDDKVIG